MGVARARRTKEPAISVDPWVVGLRLMRSIERPLCCGKPMEVSYLNLGDLGNEKAQKLSEAEYAAYLAEFCLEPVFTCDTCDVDRNIPGLVWPVFPQKATER